MDTLTAIESRRAVKHYDPNHQMTDEEITKLISLAMLAPTAFNIQNWKFVVVRDPELRKKILSVSVPEFGGIDHLPDQIKTLLEYAH